MRPTLHAHRTWLLSMALAACGAGNATAGPGPANAEYEGAVDASSDGSSQPFLDGALQPVDGGASPLFSEAASEPSSDDASAEAPTDAALCAPDFAGCTTFDDRSAQGASRTVTFQDFEYAPKCFLVKVGQTVKFAGDFARHPLRQSCGPAAVLDDANGTHSSFSFSVVGDYGYYCLDHGNRAGQVMAGAIRVVE